MKVTLRQLCESKGYSEDQWFRLKREMLTYKKTGQLFFKEDLGRLEFDTVFELYYYQTPNTRTTIDAFPVPLDHFQHKKCDLEAFAYCKTHFETYYVKHSLKREQWSDYDYKRPFIGDDYVWYFKRTSSFS